MLIKFIIGIIVMFLTVIFVHELGHYLFAKTFGCKLVRLTLGPLKIIRGKNKFDIKLVKDIRDYGGTIHIHPTSLKHVSEKKLALYFLGGPVTSIVSSIILIICGVHYHSMALLLAGGMSFGVGIMNLIPIKSRVGLYLNDGIRALEIYKGSPMGKCEYNLWCLGALINEYECIPISEKDKINRLIVADDVVYKVTALLMSLYLDGVTKKEQEGLFKDAKKINSSNPVIQKYIEQTITQMKGVIYDTNL